MSRKEEIAELRAKLAILEADEARAATAVRPPTSLTPRVIGGLFGAVAIGIALWAALGRPVDKPAPTPVPATVATNPNWQEKTLAFKPGNDVPGPPQTAWRYEEETDPINDRKTLSGCVNSRDQVYLPPPYQPTSARLCVRRSAKYGMQVVFLLNDDGQIMCDSYSSCRVRVRFDDKPALVLSGNDAADHSTNVVFLPVTRMAAGLRHAKSTLVELTYYQAGSQSVVFDTAGLDAEKVGLIK